VDIFHWHSQVVPLLQYAIHSEIEKTKEEALLFRNDSFANRLLSEFSILLGSDFVHRTFRFLIKEILEPDYDVEIDPKKIDATANLDANRKRLADITESFLGYLIESENHIPLPFREITLFLYEEAQRKYPNAQYKVIGGFIFLRWLCPAIVSPMDHGLVDKPLTTAKTRRLILVAKLLQNLANEAQAEDKESYMSYFNSFFKENIPKMRILFDKLLITESYEEKRVEAHKRRCDFNALASFLITNNALVVEKMLNFPEEELDHQTVLQLCMKFRQTVNQLKEKMAAEKVKKLE